MPNFRTLRSIIKNVEKLPDGPLKQVFFCELDIVCLRYSVSSIVRFQKLTFMCNFRTELSALQLQKGVLVSS